MFKFILMVILFLIPCMLFPSEKKFLIGKSVEGRGIYLYRFGSGYQSIVIAAGLHGNEKNSSVTAFYIINRLKNNNIIIPPDKSVFVIPEVNPDGLDHNTRTNARKVDVNRNFDTHVWKKTAPYHGTLLKCGDHPFSEPESLALKVFFEKIDQSGFISIFLTYHSQANSIIEANDYSYNKFIASYLRNISIFKNILNYPTYGDSEKWVSERFDIPSTTIEFRTKTDPENEENEKILLDLLQTDLYETFYKPFGINKINKLAKTNLLINILLETKLDME